MSPDDESRPRIRRAVHCARIIGLLALLGAAPGRSQPTPPDSLLKWATSRDAGARSQFQNWAATASIEEFLDLTNFVNEKAQAKAGVSADSSSTWPMSNLVPWRGLKDPPRSLVETKRALPFLSERLRRDPEDLAALFLFAMTLQFASVDSTRDKAAIERELESVRGAFRWPDSQPEEASFRRDIIKNIFVAAERIGLATDVLKAEFDGQLRAVFRANSRPPSARQVALHHLTGLGDQSILPDLRAILDDPDSLTEESLRLSAVHALAKLEGPPAVARLIRVLGTTSSPRVWGGTGLALSAFQSEEVLRALIASKDRFPGDQSLDLSLSHLSEILLDWLEGANLDDSRLAVSVFPSIRKGRFTTQDPTCVRDPLLVLQQCALDDVHRPIRAEILTALVQVLSHDQAREFLSRVSPEVSSGVEWKPLVKKAGRRMSSGTPTNIPTPPHLQGGNEAPKELGDPGYRRIGFLDEWTPILGDFGHTGIFAGVVPNPVGPPRERIVEVAKRLGDVTQTNDWSPMDCGSPDCWGARSLRNRTLTFQERRTIVEKAREVSEATIFYPELTLWPSIPFANFVALEAFPFSGPTIETHEIRALRCDGLVEYCYEVVGFPVWGPYGADSPIHEIETLGAHNDLYVPNIDDPDIDLAPVVQCGRAGASSHLSRDAVASPPHVGAHYTRIQIGGFVQIELCFEATDESGIHSIEFSTNEGATWTSSPEQPQYPTSASFTFCVDLTVVDSFHVLFTGMDGAGNTPPFLFEKFVDIHQDDPAAAVSSLAVRDGEASWVVEGEHETECYIVESAAALPGPWTEVAVSPSGAGLHRVSVPVAEGSLYRLVEVESGGRRLIHSTTSAATPASALSPAPAAPLTPHVLADSLRAALRASFASFPCRALHRDASRSTPGKDLLIVTVDEFLPDVQEFVEGFWEEFFDADVDVISLGAKTDPDATGRRSFVRSLVTLYSMSLSTENFLLVGDANDWQEFDGPLTSQYWVGSWSAIRAELLASGTPAGGQPALNVIPTYAVADTLPRGTNMAYVVPYVLTDRPYSANPDVVLSRWPCSTASEVLAMAEKMLSYNRGVSLGDGVPSGICYIGDLDFAGSGDGGRAWDFGQDLMGEFSFALQPHGFYRSNWGSPLWLIGEAAILWNSLGGLRLVATVGSLSTRYRPADILNKEEFSFPFHVSSLLSGPRTPIVLGASCGTADFARTERLSAQPLGPEPIVEDFLFTPGKGAAFWVGPTCGTWQLGNEVIAKTFVQELFEDRERAIAASWKEALERIAAEYPASHPVHETAAAYVFLGDPLTPFDPTLAPITAPSTTGLPLEFALGAPSPNPSTRATRLFLSNPEEGFVRLAVYDVRGRLVKVLIADKRPAGEFAVNWTGVDEAGLLAAPGIYFARAQSRGRTATRKLVRSR